MRGATDNALWNAAVFVVVCLSCGDGCVCVWMLLLLNMWPGCAWSDGRCAVERGPVGAGRDGLHSQLHANVLVSFFTFYTVWHSQLGHTE